MPIKSLGNNGVISFKDANILPMVDAYKWDTMEPSKDVEKQYWICIIDLSKKDDHRNNVDGTN